MSRLLYYSAALVAVWLITKRAVCAFALKDDFQEGYCSRCETFSVETVCPNCRKEK